MQFSVAVGAIFYISINLTKDNLNLFGYVDSWPRCTSLKLLASPLIRQTAFAEDASRIFLDTGIKITVDGRKQLGGFIGLRAAEEQYAMDNVKDLTN